MAIAGYVSLARSHAVEVLAEAITKGVAGINVTALYPVMKAAIDEQDGAGDYCHFHCVNREQQRQSLAVRSDCRVNNSFSDVLR